MKPDHSDRSLHFALTAGVILHAVCVGGVYVFFEKLESFEFKMLGRLSAYSLLGVVALVFTYFVGLISGIKSLRIYATVASWASGPIVIGLSLALPPQSTRYEALIGLISLHVHEMIFYSLLSVFCILVVSGAHAYNWLKSRKM